MRKFLSFLSILCPVGAGIIIYAAVSELFAWQDIGRIAVLLLAAVFAVASSVLCLAAASLYDRVSYMERELDIYSDRDYDTAEALFKVCPICKKEIDRAFRICPHCGNREFEDESVQDVKYGAAPDFEAFGENKEEDDGAREFEFMGDDVPNVTNEREKE